jgi:hypothetical protein
VSRIFNRMVRSSLSFLVGADEDFNAKILVPTLGLPDAVRRCYGP